MNERMNKISTKNDVVDDLAVKQFPKFTNIAVDVFYVILP